MASMLRTLLLVTIILLAALQSCKKAGDGQGLSQNGIQGSWIATEYIADPGNGDNSWHPVTGDTEVLSFDNAGKGHIFSDGVQASGYYQVDSDSTMEMVGGPFASRFLYSQRADTLDISGYCIEACATRYLRAKQD